MTALKIDDVQKIDTRVAKSYFRDKAITNLNQNPKGVLLFFPNKSQLYKILHFIEDK